MKISVQVLQGARSVSFVVYKSRVSHWSETAELLIWCRHLGNNIVYNRQRSTHCNMEHYFARFSNPHLYGIPVRTCELRDASCDLRAWLLYRVPELRAASCDLRVATCELRPAPCVLRPATCEMMNCEMRHAS